MKPNLEEGVIIVGIKSNTVQTTGKNNGVTILSSGSYFQGKLYCKHSSRIAGRVEGQIISEGLLIIEEGTQINADIKTDEVVIQGVVKGELQATGRVDLTKTSRFEGDITTPTLVIQEGAKFNGRCFMSTNENLTGKEDKAFTSIDAKAGAKTSTTESPNIAVVK